MIVSDSPLVLRFASGVGGRPPDSLERMNKPFKKPKHRDCGLDACPAFTASLQVCT